MLKLSMVEETEEYAKRCLTYIKEAESTENAEYWLERVNECRTLLRLFKEHKMYWSDWARMKEIAELNREDRAMGVNV